VTIVFVPTMLQSLTGGVKEVEVSAGNVRQVVERLDDLYPGIKERLVEEGRLRPNLAVSIDGEIARLGLLEKVAENSEVHFVPAIGGGASTLDGRPPARLTDPDHPLTMSLA
jgi:sulfur-carrier protein